MYIFPKRQPPRVWFDDGVDLLDCTDTFVATSVLRPHWRMLDAAVDAVVDAV